MKMEINRISLVFALTFGLYVTVFAQTDTTKNYVLGAFLIAPIEFPVIDTKDLNQQLENSGFPKANHAKANIGIGFQLYMNRLITTFSFNKTTKKNDQSNFVTEVEYRSTSFNFGYSLTKSQWFSIYPYVGFKGVGLNYLYREAADTTSFGNYLQTPLKYREVTNSRAHLDLGIGLAHQWFYLINFRFGYLLPIEKLRWNINNNKTTLPNSPKISYDYYFTLALGLGNIASDRDVKRHYDNY